MSSKKRTRRNPPLKRRGGMQPYSRITTRIPTSTVNGVTTNLAENTSRAISLANVTGYYGPVQPGTYHPRTYQFEDRIYPRGAITVWGSVKDERVNAFTSWVPVNGHMPETPLVLRQKAISKFYDRLKDTSLNLFEDLGELNSTKRMINDFYKTGKTGLQRAQTSAARETVQIMRNRFGRMMSRTRLNWRYVTDNQLGSVEFQFFGDRAPWSRRLDTTIKKIYLDSFCKTWLMATYGLNPLISTLKGLVNLVHSKAGQHFRVKATCFDFGIDKYKDTLADYPVRMNVDCTFKHVVQYCADFEVRDNIPFGMSRTNYFALPVKTLYDWTAFSFVLDWVVDVGSWIESVERSTLHTMGKDGLKMIRGYHTEFNSCDYQSVVDWSAVPPDGWIKPSPYVWYSPGEIWSVSRIVNTERELMHNLPYMALPVFNLDMGWRRLLSFAALMSLVVVPPKVEWLHAKGLLK